MNKSSFELRQIRLQRPVKRSFFDRLRDRLFPPKPVDAMRELVILRAQLNRITEENKRLQDEIRRTNKYLAKFVPLSYSPQDLN
jgi:hypothetical protein